MQRSYGTGTKTETSKGVWRLRYMTTKDGKRRQAEKTFRGTEAAAQRTLNALLTAEATNTPDGRTLGQLLDEWLTFKESNGAAAKTIAENRRKIDQDIRKRLGSIVLVDLTAKHLDDAYSQWLKGTDDRKALSKTTVHHFHAIISAALGQAVKWSYIDSNPAAKASPPPIALQSTEVPTPEVVGSLITKAEACNDRVMAAAISLAFVTGARRGEMCALRWSDVVLGEDVGAIRIERSISEVGKVITVKGTKSGKGRTVPIDARSVAILQKIKDEQESFAEAAGASLCPDPYVMSQSSDGSTPFEPDRLTDRFRLICQRSKVEGVRFHDLRHAHITYLIAAGVDVVAVASRVGHEQPTMTLNRYGHALPRAGDAAAAVIGGLIPS